MLILSTESDFSRSSLLPEVPSGEQQFGALPASTRSRWRQDALQTQPQTLQRTTGWDGCGPFLSEGMRCVTSNTKCLVESVFSKQKNREFQRKYLERLFDANNILCLQEVHGKDEYLQAIQVLAPRFRFFSTFILGNEIAGGSAICIHRDLLPQEAIVPRSPCELSIWATQIRYCQRPFQTWSYLEAITWQIAPYSPALACISLWGGHYFG